MNLTNIYCVPATCQVLLKALDMTVTKTKPLSAWSLHVNRRSSQKLCTWNTSSGDECYEEVPEGETAQNPLTRDNHC